MCCTCAHLDVRKAYYRAHGSPFVPFLAAAAKALGSKPVMLGFAMMELRESARSAGAGKSANWGNKHAVLTMRASLCRYVETQRRSEDCRRGLDVAVARTPCAKAARARTCHSRTCFHLHRALRILPHLSPPQQTHNHQIALCTNICATAQRDCRNLVHNTVNHGTACL